MKIKNILTSLLVLCVVLFNEGIFADTLRCDAAIYCNYQGLFGNIDNAEEEFMMLMEPPKHSNFQDMFSALLYIVGCSEKNKDCMKALKDPDCKISAYTQKLAAFYEANAAKLDDKEIVKLFEILKNGEGKMFFNKDQFSELLG
jgi:hypothetical protein